MVGKVKKSISIILAITLSSVLLFPNFALADQYDDFIAAGQQHNVISNEHFINYNSMSVADVQAFLVAKGSYLKDYVDNSAQGMGRSAAQIIWDAAHGKYEAAGTAHGVTINESTGTVSPAVILVFLQKEQSLISTTTWDDWKMTASMGYNCYAGVSGDYNNNGCKDAMEGFTLQVEWGAWQLRYNYEIAGKDATWWNAEYPGTTQYRTGNTLTVGTSRTPPSSYDVTFANQATASCYRYTPYVFYGNYNVWNLFYNTYNFDELPNGTSGSNDGSNFDAKTYQGSISVSGGKASNNRAYFNEQLISDLGATSWNITFEPALGDNTYYVRYKDESQVETGSKRIRVIRRRMSDINGDGAIDLLDLSIFASYWGQTSPAESFSDMNGDNVVDLLDLSVLATNWGR
jgi:hypothetical protein